MADLYVALIHYPVMDKRGDIVTTAVTNMDVHDIGRVSRTFGVRAFYVCTPVETLRRLVARIMRHWEVGPGATYNPTRKDALSLVRQAPDLEAVVADVERDGGRIPRIVATTAKDGPDRLTFEGLRESLRSDGPPVLVLFGTGWGLAPEVLNRCDAILEPIRGTGDWNHLPVRSAASIILDRLRNGG